MKMLEAIKNKNLEELLKIKKFTCYDFYDAESIGFIDGCLHIMKNISGAFDISHVINFSCVNVFLFKSMYELFGSKFKKDTIIECLLDSIDYEAKDVFEYIVENHNVENIFEVYSKLIHENRMRIREWHFNKLKIKEVDCKTINRIIEQCQITIKSIKNCLNNKNFIKCDIYYLKWLYCFDHNQSLLLDDINGMTSPFKHEQKCKECGIKIKANLEKWILYYIELLKYLVSNCKTDNENQSVKSIKVLIRSEKSDYCEIFRILEHYKIQENILFIEKIFINIIPKYLFY